MEIYQWLFRQHGFQVSDKGYFVYCNGDATKSGFQEALHFNTYLLSHSGDDSWVEKTLFDIKKCLTSDQIPDASLSCNYCAYWSAVKKHIELKN